MKYNTLHSEKNSKTSGNFFHAIWIISSFALLLVKGHSFDARLVSFDGLMPEQEIMRDLFISFFLFLLIFSMLNLEKDLQRREGLYWKRIYLASDKMNWKQNELPELRVCSLRMKYGFFFLYYFSPTELNFLLFNTMWYMYGNRYFKAF